MTPDIIYTYQVIGDVMMEQMDNLLLVDTNDERRQQLETVLSFMGIQWQSGGEEDCLAYLSVPAGRSSDKTQRKPKLYSDRRRCRCYS